MCFTPLASALTAGAEFAVTGYIVKKDRKKKFRPLAFFTFLLGLYQCTEVFLCLSNNAELWARFGFIAYTFLPAVLLHTLLKLSGRKFWIATYIIPVAFALLAVQPWPVVVSSVCHLVTTSIHHIIFGSSLVTLFSYIIYYGGFPVAGLVIYTRFLQSEKSGKISRGRRWALSAIPFAVIASQLAFIAAAYNGFSAEKMWIAMSVFVVGLLIAVASAGTLPFIRKVRLFRWILIFLLATSGVTAFILFLVFPEFNYSFPSIYCQFALLYALAAVLIVREEN